MGAADSMPCLGTTGTLSVSTVLAPPNGLMPPDFPSCQTFISHSSGPGTVALT